MRRENSDVCDGIYDERVGLLYPPNIVLAVTNWLTSSGAGEGISLFGWLHAPTKLTIHISR